MKPRMAMWAVLILTSFSACVSQKQPADNESFELFIARLERSAVPPNHSEFASHNPACAVYFKENLFSSNPFSTEDLFIVGRPDEAHYAVEHNGKRRIIGRLNVVCKPCSGAIPEIKKLIEEWKREHDPRRKPY